MSDSTPTLEPCPFCGKVPERISAMTYVCSGMVNGVDVHNSIAMRPAAWAARAALDASGNDERLFTVEPDGSLKAAAGYAWEFAPGDAPGRGTAKLVAIARTQEQSDG